MIVIILLDNAKRVWRLQINADATDRHQNRVFCIPGSGAWGEE